MFPARKSQGGTDLLRFIYLLTSDIRRLLNEADYYELDGLCHLLTRAEEDGIQDGDLVRFKEEHLDKIGLVFPFCFSKPAGAGWKIDVLRIRSRGCGRLHKWHSEGKGTGGGGGFSMGHGGWDFSQTSIRAFFSAIQAERRQIRQRAPHLGDRAARKNLSSKQRNELCS